MARERRTDEQHGYFHLWNRGVDRQDIFVDDRDREVFVEVLGEVAEEVGVEVHAFSLMSNHFHLVVHCPSGGLSAFAQQLQRRYAEYYNRRVDRVGHLFAGRFSSTILSDDSDIGDFDDVLSVMVRYVHRNPLDRLAIADLEHDRFSSYGAYLGRRREPTWLRTDTVLARHGQPEQLRRFTEQAHPSDKTPKLGRVVEPYSPDDVMACVASEFGAAIDAVLSPASARDRMMRDLAAHLCLGLRVEGVDALAERFGVTQRTVRRMAARGKDRCGGDRTWAALRTSVSDHLWSRQLAARAA